MTWAFASTLRQARAQQIPDTIDAGAAAGKVRIYSGTRPATGGAVTTLLCEIDLNDPSGSASGPTMTWNVTPNPQGTAVAAGVATWARIVDSDDNFVTDCDVGEGSGDLQLDNTNIALNQVVKITGGALTEGNP